MLSMRSEGAFEAPDHSRRIEKSDVGVAVRTRIAPTAPPVRADVDVILLRRIRSDADRVGGV